MHSSRKMYTVYSHSTVKYTERVALESSWKMDFLAESNIVAGAGIICSCCGTCSPRDKLYVFIKVPGHQILYYHIILIWGV